MRNNKQYDKTKTKPRMKTTYFEKAFNSLAEMISELKTLHPEFVVIFPYEDEVVTPKDASSDVLKYFENFLPDVISGKNLPISISVAANKVSLKTLAFFSISWKFTYDRSGEISDLVATICTYTKEKNHPELDAMISTLEESWTVVSNDR